MEYRVVILGSGKGSNGEAILKAERDGALGRARVVGIISDIPGAGILDVARRYGVESRCLSGAPYKTKLDGDAELNYIEKISDWNPDLIVLAGFMRVIKDRFLEAFQGKIINLHPSLLPRHPGLDAIRKAYEAGDSEAGCTVHWVNAEVDGGEIIDRKAVPIKKGDDLASLEARVHRAEHTLLPSVIAMLSERKEE